jgi:formyl-CoA transferase
MIVDLNYPKYGDFKTVGCPIKLSASPADITRPPELGEHSEEVLRELCGVTEKDFARLKDDGVT